MIDLTDPIKIKALKEAFDYSFKGPLGEQTLEFLEEFCGFWNGGPVDADGISSNKLQYDRGKRDVILTIKTIKKPEWDPEKIAEIYKRQE